MLPSSPERPLTGLRSIVLIGPIGSGKSAVLSKRGWRILSDRDVLDDGAPVMGHGRTVVVLPDNELSRARGGPRCMTMPLEREPL